MNWSSLYDGDPRRINYLRVSVTDRCNLRCRYCMGEEGIRLIPHDEVLSYEELLRVIRLASERGIRKVRITGGEPLVRKGLCEFIRTVNGLPGIRETALTTNGVLLGEFAEELFSSGVRHINVSMDSLKPECFESITGRPHFEKVWNGIREAERLGFDPIKLNMVVIRGWNDDEVVEFARLTYSKPYHVRFIEFMPLGDPAKWKEELVVGTDEIRGRIQELGPLEPIHRSVTSGPASTFRLKGARGRIGFISAVSHQFCSTCNRLRLTAEGRLRTCLFSDMETDLKSPMRNGISDEGLLGIMDQAVRNKPRGHLLEADRRPDLNRRMWGIGG